MDKKIQALITMRKSIDWQILKHTGYDMTKIYKIGDKHADTSLYMRAAGALCIISLSHNMSGSAHVKLIHPWDSHGISQDDLSLELWIDVEDLIPIKATELSTL
jgi:hypothetical protein